MPVGISWDGWTLEKYQNYGSGIPAFLRKNGYLCVNKFKDDKYYCGRDNLQGFDKFKEAELIAYTSPPINLCPENKTVTELSITYEFDGAITTCTIQTEDGTFTGIAKCSPEDTWDEYKGMNLAYNRADQKRIKARIRELKGN